jgi:O-acetyl-ADP-ribose deacetylase (regulator of RNase III)
MSGRVVLCEGDLTEQDVDALVNAADSELGFGTGVARAIRDKAGPSIEVECEALRPIPVGEAAVTGAGNLRARWVVHAATMPPRGKATEESVRSAMRRSLALAAERGCRSVAVPALGAGAAGLSLQRSAEILIEEATRHLEATSSVREVRFVLRGEPSYRVFEAVQDARRIAEQLARLGRGRDGPAPREEG